MKVLISVISALLFATLLPATATAAERPSHSHEEARLEAEGESSKWCKRCRSWKCSSWWCKYIKPNPLPTPKPKPVTAAPEPATMSLLGLGALGLAYSRRRKRRDQGDEAETSS